MPHMSLSNDPEGQGPVILPDRFQKEIYGMSDKDLDDQFKHMLDLDQPRARAVLDAVVIELQRRRLTNTRQYVRLQDISINVHTDDGSVKQMQATGIKEAQGSDKVMRSYIQACTHIGNGKVAEARFRAQQLYTTNKTLESIILMQLHVSLMEETTDDLKVAAAQKHYPRRPDTRLFKEAAFVVGQLLKVRASQTEMADKMKQTLTVKEITSEVLTARHLEGRSREIAALFPVAPSSVEAWEQQQREIDSEIDASYQLFLRQMRTMKMVPPLDAIAFKQTLKAMVTERQKKK